MVVVVVVGSDRRLIDTSFPSFSVVYLAMLDAVETSLPCALGKGVCLCSIDGYKGLSRPWCVAKGCSPRWFAHQPTSATPSSISIVGAKLGVHNSLRVIVPDDGTTICINSTCSCNLAKRVRKSSSFLIASRLTRGNGITR